MHIHVLIIELNTVTVTQHLLLAANSKLFIPIYAHRLSFMNLQAESTFRSELEPAGITVVSRTFKTTEDPVDAIKDLFVRHPYNVMIYLSVHCCTTILR